MTPIKIEICPIVEANVEIQFQTQLPKGTLFGIIYNIFRDKYKTVLQLPLNQIPEEIRISDPNFKFKPLHKLTDGQFSILIGDDVLSFQAPSKYVGWDLFSDKINHFFKEIKKINAIEFVSRFSLRYLNFFENDIFKNIDLEVKMMGSNYNSSNILFRTEFEEDEFIKVLQIANSVTLNSNNIKRNGSIIDISCVIKSPNDFFNKSNSIIDKAHLLEKNLFFGLLKDDFIKSLKPSYE
ncbi:MAG: TIGR04255 family protein [Flavobacteriaceae bacterium]